MKLFNVTQISAIDKFTIENEPVKSIDLMERASIAIFNKIKEFFSKDQTFIVVAGPGNNGGDGLAVARLLHLNDYTVKVVIPEISNKLSDDCQKNYDAIRLLKKVKLIEIKKINELHFDKDEIIIDALFGSGLSRILEGLSLDIVRKINLSGCKIISIDLPSGLFGEDNSLNNVEGIINADYTLTLQFPKISFFFAENSRYVGKWFVLPINLHPEIIKSEPSLFYYFERCEAKNLVKIREKFSHKGNYGHALLISGGYGKMGAAVLSSRACLRSGAGLLTTHIPACGYTVLQTAVPETMVSTDTCNDFVTELPDIQNYSVIGIGPGIGMDVLTAELIYKLLLTSKLPMVFDADALNILSENKQWLKILPKNTILTPHPKEFDRLAGVSENSFERHKKAKQFAVKFQVVIILKGAYTQVISPKGECYFNSTGNPGMATGGSGDVLTGIILGLLSQGYTSIEASTLGVYLHGLSGDIAERYFSQEAIIAGDLIDNIGNAFKEIQAD